MTSKDSSSTGPLVDREALFTTIIGILEPEGITSDISYYVDGKATEVDYKGIISAAFERTAAGSAERAQFVDILDDAGFWASTDDLDYWRDTAKAADLGNINDLKNVAYERLSVIGTDAQDFVAPQEGLIEPEGKDEAKGLEGIMAGGTLTRVKNEEGQEDFYIVSYEYPPGSGHSFYYRFNDLETLKASVGDDFAGIDMDPDGMNEADLKEWTDGGDSNEILGITGSFTGYINDLVNEVSANAGIDDPTRLGKALANEGVQLIMAKAAEGEWSNARVKAALRDNDYYKDVLYPGIENFYGQTDNPEAAFAMYQQNVTANLDKLGIPKDADGSYGSTIKSMLDSGITDTRFAAFAPTFLRTQGNEEYRKNVNKWLEASGQAPLSDFNSFFDLLAGNSPQEIKDVVELAGLSYVASQQGLGLGEDLIQQIAERTDMSDQQVGEAFSASDRDLLALGPEGLRTAGISMNDIVATRSGFTTGARSLGEMQNLIRKVKTEQGIADDPTATIFTDFNREGAPVKRGLAATISEGA